MDDDRTWRGEPAPADSLNTTPPHFSNKDDAFERAPAHVEPHEPNPSDPPPRARAPEPTDGEGNEGPTPAPDGRASIYDTFRRERNRNAQPTPTLTDGVPRDVVNLDTTVDPDDQDALERQTSEEIERLTGRRLDDEARAGFGLQPASERQPAEPAPAPTPAAEQNLTLKVNHALYTVTRAQAAEIAGLTAAEAEGMKVDTLIKVAQISAANQLRTKQPSRDPDAAPQAPASTERAPQDGRTDAPSPDDDLDVDALQLGTKEEARAAVDKFLSKKLEAEFSRRELAQRDTQVRSQIGQALHAFNAENQDVLGDDEAGDFALARTTTGMVRSLADLGILSGRDLAALRANPSQVTELYVESMKRGLPVKAPKLILDAAAAETRKRFGKPAVEPAPAARPAPAQRQPEPASAAASRLDAKRNLAQISSRSGNDVRPAQANSQMDKRASAIANMRKARGQLSA